MVTWVAKAARIRVRLPYRIPNLKLIIMIEFLLGAAIITLIYQGVKLNKVLNQVTALKGNETEIINTIYKNDELIHRRVDQEIDRTNGLYTDSIRHTNERVNEKKSKKKLLKG